MDEKTDNVLRMLVANQAAHSFIVSYLLRALFIDVPRPQRLKVAEMLLDASTQTAHFSDVAKGDDFAAERLSDMVIQMQQHVDQLIGQALEATAAVEEGSFGRGQ